MARKKRVRPVEPRVVEGDDASSVATDDIDIETIVQIGAAFKDLHFERGIQGEPAPVGDTTVSLDVEIQVLIDEPTRRLALVRLAITARPDGPPIWEASADYVAVYSFGENSPLSPEAFAWSNGLANLVPFVRQRIAALTQASNYATYIMPPVSVTKLRELYEKQRASRLPSG